MKIVEIYVHITGHNFQGINIHRQRINGQHFMLSRSLIHNISIDTHKQERFPKFILSGGVYITHQLNLVKM